MCRFKGIGEDWEAMKESFNTSYVSVQVRICDRKIDELKKFQYILCVSSSQTTVKKTNSLRGFNTSYVSVQVDTKMPINLGDLQFQYILCVGSSLPP